MSSSQFSLYQLLINSTLNLTNPSSGINPSVFYLGSLFIQPRGFGSPDEFKQFISGSFSLF